MWGIFKHIIATMLLRGWMLLSTLVFSVLFKLWPDYGNGYYTFIFSSKTLNNQSWIYFMMEHLIAVYFVGVMLIKDSTPQWLLWLFFAIVFIDGAHFVLFFRDEGIGFNLAKAILFGLPLLYLETRNQWKHLKRFMKQE